MSVQTTYTYTTSSNYTFDNTKIKISNGKASLVIADNTGQTFTEDYASDSGFTYDSGKAEFFAGQVQQKDQSPANALSWATYTSTIDLSVGGGTLTGTGTGSPGITANKLDLTGNTIKYVDYDADLNADSQQTLTIRLKVTPNYSDKAANNQYLYCVGKDTSSNNNLIQIYHNSGNGYMAYVLYNSAGGLEGSGVLARWNPTAGNTYEMALCCDFTSGATRLFIDGVQSGSTLTQVFTRDSDIGFLRIGSDRTGVFASNFSVEDFVFYDVSLYTANYTPGYTLEETKYLGSKVELPAFTYSDIGSIQALTNLVNTESGAPKWVINDLYYNSGWVASDGSYSQANTTAEIVANLSTFTAADTINLDIVFTDTNTQGLVSNTVLTYTGQAYPTDNPTIETNTSFRTDDLVSFAETSTKTSSEIKHILKKDNIWYYWTGSAWAESDLTYSQSNTATEINTNADDFTSLGVDVLIRSFLHSNDGNNTPELDLLTVTYDYTGPDVTLNTAIVYGNIFNIIGTAKEASNFKVRPGTVLYGANTMMLKEWQTITIRSDGYFEVSIKYEDVEYNVLEWYIDGHEFYSGFETGNNSLTSLGITNKL